MNFKIPLFLKNYWALLVLIAIKLFLQYFLVNPEYELHRDEFLHLDQAFHLAFGYISVPPLTSWISVIIYSLGGGLFWIRLIPALFGTLTVVVTWLIVEELDGRLAAKILASSFVVFSVLLRLNVLYQPNAFDILAWTLVFYFIIRYIKTEQIKWFCGLVLVVVLGFYNKYNIIFLLIGLIPGLLLTQHRKIFSKKSFYLIFFIALFLMLPNIIWQIKNQFPVLHHMEVLNKTQLQNNNRVDFLIDQVKFNLIGLLTIAAFWSLLFYKAFKPYRFILWTFIIVISLYIILRAKNYYAVGLCPVLFALGSVYIENILKGKWKPIVISTYVIFNSIIYTGLSLYIMPFYSPSEIVANKQIFEKFGLLRWEDGQNHMLPQDFANMIGWKEMAGIALKAYSMLPDDEKENTIVYADNYGQAGAVNYYNRKLMPEAYSFNSDYLFWFPEKINIRNLIYIGQPPVKIYKNFQDYKLIGEVENIYSREKGTTIYLLTGADSAFTKLVYKEVAERRVNFDCF